MTDAAIHCAGLQKVYRTGFFRRAYTALHGLDLEVRRGEVFGFIGPNGAGKTTTIKILMGLNAATGGRATILGRPVGDVAARARVGFLPERPYFYDYLTAKEFLHFHGQLHGLDRARRDARIAELLPLVRMEHAADTQLRKFSKGMLQRIGLAQALVNEPDLVVLDEPSSGLDPMGRRLIRDVIRTLRERGTTVFFSSHVLSDVEEVSDRVGIMLGGRLVQVGTVDELVGEQILAVEVTLDGAAGAEAVAPARTTPSGQRVFVFPGHDEARRFVREALVDGAALAGYAVVRESLEQFFVDEATAVTRQAREAGAR